VTQYDAILPAGGRIDPDFAKAVGTDRKALIEIDGQTILSRTLEALRATGQIGRSVLIGPEEITNSPSAADATLKIRERSSGPENIMAGLQALEEHGGPRNKVLVVTTDLPFISPQSIQAVLDRYQPELDILVPICTQPAYQTMFPNSTSTFIRLRDHGYTAGGVYVMDPDALRRAMPMIVRLFENRKSKLGMAKLLGPTLLVKFFRKTLTIDDVESKAMSLLNLKGKAYRDAPPELAYDIDYLDDYEYAIKHLAHS
jgi:GTP:adenosylcobinamide-phosphate guanylyltransferase